MEVIAAKADRMIQCNELIQKEGDIDKKAKLIADGQDSLFDLINYAIELKRRVDEDQDFFYRNEMP